MVAAKAAGFGAGLGGLGMVDVISKAGSCIQ